ncbi:MAG: hypothetical protein A2X36_15105 [Elusimicrobia bacterium GWA2_69_24]|nr:MAG: hypothetical protein A2X36_15105 [Elusimicrobia bacterium GWA2_69_24]HBL16496.1 hypothetical protein [Elusimicrobiota bacterium]
MKAPIIFGLAAVLSGCFAFPGNPPKNTQKMTCVNEAAESPKDVKVKAGAAFCFLYGRHLSVGSDIAFLPSGDEGVVVFRGERSDYLNPKRAHMPGGDGRSVWFIFEALKPGQATLTFQLKFRGAVEATPVYRITVEPG